MKVNDITYNKLSYLKYYLKDEMKGLPHRNGIYYWVYWPKFDENEISSDDLVKLIYEFSKKKLAYSESFSGQFKFEGEIYEQWFPNNGNLFGLPPSSNKKLLDQLKNREGIKVFYGLFKELCFARPFYIGKANDLQSRLQKHFNGSQSTIIEEIDNLKISHAEIWVGYRLVEDKKNIGLNRVFEEIFSRTFKPGLTKKPN